MKPDRWYLKMKAYLMVSMRNLRRKFEGFTLIEMILVATLIVILSTLAIASMRAARNKGFETGAATGLKSLAAAEEMFLADNGRYAGGFSVLATTYLPQPYAPIGGVSTYIKQYSVVWAPSNIGAPGTGLVNLYSLNTYTIFARPRDADLKYFMITDSGAVQVLKGSAFIPY